MPSPRKTPERSRTHPVDERLEDQIIIEETLPGVLITADWTVDPHAVVAAGASRAELYPARFALLVPAWLHGLDWAGDPRASVPCARRQLARIESLCAAAGLELTGSEVGDPDPVTAICDAAAHWEMDEVLLCTRGRHPAASPFHMARRVRRASGLPVRHLSLPPARRARRSGHCAVAAA